jgi:hypothetical protein
MTIQVVVSRIGKTVLHRGEWSNAASLHRAELDKLLYPTPTSSQVDSALLDTKHGAAKHRMHAVNKHPIFNFLHKYYSYSAESLKQYSPGMACLLTETNVKDFEERVLHSRFAIIEEDRSVQYQVIDIRDFRGQQKIKNIRRNRELLKNTMGRNPVFSCYGLHEWAMLYKGNTKHQHELDLRVSQTVSIELKYLAFLTPSLTCSS